MGHFLKEQTIIDNGGSRCGSDRRQHTIKGYVDTNEPIPIGQEIYLSFFNPFSYKHMDLGCKIIWSSTQGIGVSFNDLSRARYIW